MDRSCRPPSGPRGHTGADAEEAAARHLVASGWSILARNVRVGRDELDIVALEPGTPPTAVVVEVRSHTTGRFGSPRESVGLEKVRRLYRAAARLQSAVAITAVPGHEDTRTTIHAAQQLGPWRVDLLTMVRDVGGRWMLEAHLRGLAPP